MPGHTAKYADQGRSHVTPTGPGAQPFFLPTNYPLAAVRARRPAGRRFASLELAAIVMGILPVARMKGTQELFAASCPGPRLARRYRRIAPQTASAGIRLGCPFYVDLGEA